MIREDEIISAFDTWTDRFSTYVAQKGKVEPGEFRAFGFEAPGHKWADLRLKWRETRIKAGYAPAGSSPAAQENLGLNQEQVFLPL